MCTYVHMYVCMHVSFLWTVGPLSYCRIICIECAANSVPANGGMSNFNVCLGLHASTLTSSAIESVRALNKYLIRARWDGQAIIAGIVTVDLENVMCVSVCQ